MRGKMNNFSSTQLNSTQFNSTQEHLLQQEISLVSTTTYGEHFEEGRPGKILAGLSPDKYIS